MLDRAILAAALTAEAALPLILPLIVFLACIGWVEWMAPRLLDVLPLEQWPALPRLAYQLLH